MGAVITAARKLSGLSQEDVAGKLGVTRRSVGEWERSGRIPEHRMDQLRELYGDSLRRAEADPDQLADVIDLGAGETAQPVTVEYRGYRVTMYPRRGATSEELRRAEESIMIAVMQKLRELGLDDDAEAGTP